MTIHRLSGHNIAVLDCTAPEVFSEPVNPALLTAYLADPVNLMVVAREDGIVVARITAVIHRHVDKPADLYVDELDVAPTHRRCGIARRLIDEVSAWAAERGCVDGWLATEAGNTAAHALYDQLATAKPCVLYYWPFEDG